MKNKVFLTLLLVASALLLTWFYHFPNLGHSQPEAISLPDLKDHYSLHIQPIFNKRCVACHSCFNSPCQLNLTSYEGVHRGASQTNIYDFPKFEARSPTRLGIDAHSVAAWRDMGFFSVTSGKNQSLMTYLITKLPGIESGKQQKYDAEYSRQCIKSSDKDSLEKFVEKNPAGRMPLGFPAITQKETQTINSWIAEGASGPDQTTMQNRVLNDTEVQEKIKTWENFFNGQSLKNKIVARYFYEHLFLANLYFSDSPHLFFRLIRAKRNSSPIVEIPTALPFDDPKSEFDYKIIPITNTLVYKSHIPFELTAKKMAKWNREFIEAQWPKKPEKFPDYGDKGSNPFSTFAAMPVAPRYQLFLDNSHYFIMTFIKGPVCRGQTALNVINDHFWVFFLDPKKDPMVQSSQTYKKIATESIFPSKIGSEFKPFKDFRDKYWKAVEIKFQALAKMGGLSLSSIWQGQENNPNANITVYRHFDSAHVLFGLRGQQPKTFWVLDYQVFESIYYNLSAGYNVFGPLLHQLNSRLYMEVSRIASEDLFLSFMTPQSRVQYRHDWSIPVPSEKESSLKKIVDFFTDEESKKFNSEYKFAGNKIATDQSLVKASDPSKLLELFEQKIFSDKQVHPSAELAKDLKQFQNLNSKTIEHLPDTILLKIHNEKEVKLWTIIHNKDHYNVSMILFEQLRRRPSHDSIDIIQGLATSYANLIIDIKARELGSFYNDLNTAKNSGQVWEVLKKYGLSRSSKNFWSSFDELNTLTTNSKTNERGIVDLNRYINL